MKRRFSFLGFEFYWKPDRQGIVRIQRRTARHKLQAARARMKAWIRQHRHLPGREFIRRLNARLRGHYNYYGVRGNWHALKIFYDEAIEYSFKWLNRRGGKRKSFTWKQFTEALDRLGVAKPRITEQKRRRVFA
jgi:hypothetical protein